jgi:hypothetical protein
MSKERSGGAHDLGISVGRVAFKAGIPKISWEPLLTKLEPHIPDIPKGTAEMSAKCQKQTFMFQNWMPLVEGIIC